MLVAMRGLAIAAVLAVTRIALAGPTEATEATAAFDRGRDLAKAGRFDEACVEFGKSYELDPAPGTAVNLGDCLERQGHFQRAWQLFDRVARSEPSGSRARFARGRADALAARLATVMITLHEPAAPGLVVRIGTRGLTPAAQIRELVEPSDVEVVATVPGKPSFRTVRHAAAGAIVVVDVPSFTEPRDEPVTTRRRRPYLYIAGGLGAAGAAALVTSTVLGLEARDAYRSALANECAPMNIVDGAGYALCKARVDRAGVRADHATAIAIGGGAVVVAAAAVLLFAPREAIQVAPVATDRAVGLAMVGRF
jgi:tetratricopeptide (TPR) repeat protein